MIDIRRLAFIGGGNMAAALIGGLIRQGLPSSRIVVADPSAREFLRSADPVLRELIDAHPDFRPRAWLNELPPRDAFGSLRSDATISSRTVRSLPQFSARAVSLEALSGSSLGPNHGTSRNGAACMSFRSAAVSVAAPNFCCAINSSAVPGSAEAKPARSAAAANDRDATHISITIAIAPAIAFRSMNIVGINAWTPHRAKVERGISAASPDAQPAKDTRRAVCFDRDVDA